jgi:hypothetical protein
MFCQQCFDTDFLKTSKVLTRSQELVLLEQGKAVLHGVVAAALERLVLDVALEILVQSRWVRLVHLVDLVGVLDSSHRGRNDNDHVVVGLSRGNRGKVRVYTALSVFKSKARCRTCLHLRITPRIVCLASDSLGRGMSLWRVTSLPSPLYCLPAPYT